MCVYAYSHAWNTNHYGAYRHMTGMRCMYAYIGTGSELVYVHDRACVWVRVLACACGYVFKLVLSTQARAYIHTHTRSCACACACWCTRREHVREKSERWLPLVSSPGPSTCTATQSAACRWACSTPLRRFGECTCFDALCISSSSPPPLSACLPSFPSVFHLSLHPPPPLGVYEYRMHTRVHACMCVHACTHTRLISHGWIYTWLFIRLHMLAHMRTYICTYACVFARARVRVHALAFVFLRTYMYIRISVYMYEYTCMKRTYGYVYLYMYLHVYACTCTHACLRACTYQYAGTCI